MVASSVNRTRTSLALLVVVAATLCLEGNAFAEKVCYQDARGRISIRRGPGAVPVPCPNQEAETPADLVTPPPGSAPAAGTADLGPEFGRVPNAVSPVPVPPERNRKTDECMARSNCLDSSVVEAIPDRWRIVDALPGYESRWWDPYNRNVLKADKPVTDSKWFFNFSGISDTVYEYRQVPTPVGLSSTGDAGEIDVFGSADQQAVVQTIATEFVYYKGNTVFQPPDYEFRFTPVFNLNYVQLDETLGVNVDPREGDDRTDSFVGIQAAFIDKHLRNVSDRFDFDSIRIGIQPFSSDFRGFLFQDNQLGIRLFGTRANNVFQYNLGYFRRLEKDTNSGLNDLGQSLRDDDVVVANLYWQDLFVKGFTSQATILYNRNREDDGNYYNKNGFIERPASVGGERRLKAAAAGQAVAVGFCSRVGSLPSCSSASRTRLRLARTLQLRAHTKSVCVLASRSGLAVAALPPVPRRRLRATVGYVGPRAGTRGAKRRTITCSRFTRWRFSVVRRSGLSRVKLHGGMRRWRISCGAPWPVSRSTSAKVPARKVGIRMRGISMRSGARGKLALRSRWRRRSDMSGRSMRRYSTDSIGFARLCIGLCIAELARRARDWRVQRSALEAALLTKSLAARADRCASRRRHARRWDHRRSR